MGSQYVSKNLVNAKFLLLLIQLIACILSLLVRQENIAAGLNANFKITDQAYLDAQIYELSFGALSVIFQFIEIGLIFLGLTLQFNRINSVLCLFHFIGAGTYIFFLLDKWHFMIISYLWIVFCLIPITIELLASIQAYILYGISLRSHVVEGKQSKLKNDEDQKIDKGDEELLKEIHDENVEKQ